MRQILKLEPNLPIPVPVEELAIQLDIERIAELETDGFEGGLITDDDRSTGIILVNRKAFKGRRKFTVGHELGHFLMRTHRPVHEGRFLCSREDMRRWSAKDNDTYACMEVQANRFAALLLMPPPKLRSFMGKFRDPDVRQIVDVAKHFDVSKDAASRAYAEHNDSAVAIAVVSNGKMLRIYRNLKFPRLCVSPGDAVPARSSFHRRAALKTNPSDLLENGAELWVESEWGKRLPTLYEQVFLQQEGFALIMLWAELEEEDEDEDEDERRTSKEGLRHRQS